VADPTSNTLLVKASAVDMLTIRKMLNEVLDTGTTDSNAIAKDWIIPVKYASAFDIYYSLKDLYREDLNPAATSSGGGRAGFINAVVGASTRDPNKGVSLSLSYDSNSNSILANCSETKYKQIVSLVEKLDKAVADTNAVVRVPAAGQRRSVCVARRSVRFPGSYAPDSSECPTAEWNEQPRRLPQPRRRLPQPGRRLPQPGRRVPQPRRRLQSSGFGGQGGGLCGQGGGFGGQGGGRGGGFGGPAAAVAAAEVDLLLEVAVGVEVGAP